MNDNLAKAGVMYHSIWRDLLGQITNALLY